MTFLGSKSMLLVHGRLVDASTLHESWLARAVERSRRRTGSNIGWPRASIDASACVALLQRPGPIRPFVLRLGRSPVVNAERPNVAAAKDCPAVHAAKKGICPVFIRSSRSSPAPVIPATANLRPQAMPPAPGTRSSWPVRVRQDSRTCCSRSTP